MEHFITMKGTSILATLRMTKRMVMEFINTLAAAGTKVNGSTIYNRAKALKSGPTAPNTKVSTSVE